jgi:uncharacterized protein (TIGR00369 family)
MTARFDHYDADMAAGILASHAQITGLPGYLGIRADEIEPGRLVCSLDARAELLNPFGSLHGGVVSALFDHVLGAVVYPLIPRGAWAATTEFKVNLLAAISTGQVTAVAEVVSLTRRTAVVRIDVSNLDRLVAIGQGTVLITQPRTPEPERDAR